MIKVFVWVFAYAFAMALSQVLLKIGVSQVGGLTFGGMSDNISLAVRVLTNYYILGSIFLMMSSFFLWIWVLSWNRLEVVFPLTAVMYIILPALAFFVFGEKLSPVNYFGIFLIVAGVYAVLYQ